MADRPHARRRKAPKSAQDRRSARPPAEYELPVWVEAALRRVTPTGRADAALQALDAAAAALRDGRFDEALREGRRAKQLASRDATVREVVALAAYRLRLWDEALRELRTYRRLAGDDAHVPLELDVLRALGRDEAVDQLWETAHPRLEDESIRAEAIVVYGSYLLEQGRIEEAADVVGPVRLNAEAPEWELRRWYVAARVAAALGDAGRSREIAAALEATAPDTPGLEELEELLEAD